MKAIAIALVAAFALTAGVNQKPAEPLVEKFLAAETAADAEAMAAQFGQFDPDSLYKSLQQGRTYLDEKRGEYSLRWKSKSGPYFNNVVEVPGDYDPAQKWQLRVQLHGGVGRPSPNAQAPGRQPAPGGGTPNRIEGEKQIYLHPSGWIAAQWWDEEQVDNILRAVDTLKRKYNIDESKIYITGISDGGTGVYYMALKEPNLWSSYLPLNGSLAVLRSPENGADGEMYGNNFINSPLYIVNGENDPLYPVAQVEPHITWLKKMGVTVTFRPQAGAVHNTAWWPTERAPFEQFVHEHPRVAHPAALSWETERVDRFNRNRWLIINELRADASRATELTDLGFFRHTKRSGRVDIRRKANTFDAMVRDVAAFTLLLSPDAIDFTKPVVVTVNGKQVFSGAVKKDPVTLMRWAARDNDRTALYEAELEDRRSVILLLSIALLQPAADCRADSPAITAVRAVADGIVAADNARDLTRVMNSYAADAWLLPPNDLPVRGHAAIRPRYEALFNGFNPAIEGRIDEVCASGSIAFVRGHNGGRMVSRTGAPPRVLDDAYMMTLRLEPDGRWRISHLMWHPQK